MANDVLTGIHPALRPVHEGRAPTTATDASGNLKPQSRAGGKAPPRPAVSDPRVDRRKEQESSRARQAALAALAERIGHFLRESGRPISFKVESAGGRPVIHEIDPDTGEVLAEITPENLMSLARGLGLSGSLIDHRA